MKKILLTKEIINDVLKELGDYEVDIWDESKDGYLTKDKLKSIIAPYSGIISMLSNPLNEEVLKEAKNLEIIAQYAVGYNNIDVNYCKQNNITITNTPDVLSHATAELAFALLLNIARNISTSAQETKEGAWKGWEPKGYLGTSLKNLKLGVIGPGRIGTEFTKMCQGAFNHEVFYYSRSIKEDFEQCFQAKRLELNELMKSCDIISLHCPLTNETKNLLNKDNLHLLKKNAILINTARGEVIDQDDLVDILCRRNDLKVGLDVTTPEPLDTDHELFKLKNVIITPHIGSATTTARTEMGNIVCKSVKDHFLGRTPKFKISHENH